jgi:hypothetical protein
VYIEPAINSQKPKVEKKQNAYEVASMKHLIFITTNPSSDYNQQLHATEFISSEPRMLFFVHI